MSWDSAHYIEDVLHLINPEHYKHLEDIPMGVRANKNYTYNQFQYALEQYIKEQNLNASNLYKEYFETDQNTSEKSEQLVKRILEISCGISGWTVRSQNRVINASKTELVRNSLLDLMETPPETFDLSAFKSDPEYRGKFAAMFYEKTGICLQNRMLWQLYSNS